MYISDLMYYLAETNPNNRKLNDLDFDNLIVYHITKSENIEGIKENGIIAYSSKQSYDRPNAVYFFVSESDLDNENINLLGLKNSQYQILKVRIPTSEIIKKMKWDGLYNVTFGTSTTAVQFFDKVPTDWILSYDHKGTMK